MVFDLMTYKAPGKRQRSKGLWRFRFSKILDRVSHVLISRKCPPLCAGRCSSGSHELFPNRRSLPAPVPAFCRTRRWNSGHTVECCSLASGGQCRRAPIPANAESSIRSVISGMLRRSSLVRMGPFDSRQRMVPFQRPSITDNMASIGHGESSFFETGTSAPPGQRH
jgi:hypothetical protein